VPTEKVVPLSPFAAENGMLFGQVYAFRTEMIGNRPENLLQIYAFL
jgi:uncharacterized membrane protein YdjX (TVP38/TMEM64 family)